MSALIATQDDVAGESRHQFESPLGATQHVRTIWGLSSSELHDRYWAARGVQVIRFGQPSRLVNGAELYLLMDPWSLTAFPPARLVDRLYWAGAAAIVARLRDDRQSDYEERVVTDAGGRFAGLQRVYGAVESRFARVILTPDKALADAWQAARDSRTAWQNARKMVPKSRRLIDRVRARVYDSRVHAEQTAFVRRLAELWLRPDMTIARATRAGDGLWRDPSSQLGQMVKTLGNAWIGAGRELPGDVTVVGPVVLWDLPQSRPPAEEVQWDELEPTAVWYQRAIRHARDRSRFNRALKRVFDIGFSLAALLFMLPLTPIVMLLIWLEDGRPFFFSHARETQGGREFPCWKFRSMRKDAEEIRRRLVAQNQADGPQFFIENDPRLTRVGKLIRKLNIDELPQFFNVLMGDMSVVGPRPSPRAENQFCPSWREARLSVRPGITGLWQIMRTRRPGMDFQEWIKYDLEYVERMGMRFDLAIIWQTIWLILGGKRKR